MVFLEVGFEFFCLNGAVWRRRGQSHIRANPALVMILMDLPVPDPVPR